MKRSTALGLGLAAVVVLGGGLAFASGGSKKKIKAGQADFVPGFPAKEVEIVPPEGYPPGFVPPAGPSRTGITVGLDCQVNLYDVATAKKTAYRLGRSEPSLEAAKAALYNFGQCGLQTPLKISSGSLRGMHEVLHELLRGVVETKKLERPLADAMLRDNIIRIALRAVSTSGLRATV